eukprot:scaffold2504_cov94-Cylindrotheca_fusiformis.AAC.3
MPSNIPNSLNLQLGSPDLTFPFRLFLLLKQSEEQGMEHIISWASNGKAFKVHDPAEFEKKLLAKHFKMKKYASFTRQLCAYGFSCVRKGRQTGICKCQTSEVLGFLYHFILINFCPLLISPLDYHPNFTRDDLYACSRISRGGGKTYSAESKKVALNKNLSPQTPPKGPSVATQQVNPLVSQGNLPSVFLYGQNNSLRVPQAGDAARNNRNPYSNTPLSPSVLSQQETEVLRNFLENMRQAMSLNAHGQSGRVSPESPSSKSRSSSLNSYGAAPSILSSLASQGIDVGSPASLANQGGAPASLANQAIGTGAPEPSSNEATSFQRKEGSRSAHGASGLKQPGLQKVFEPRAIEDMVDK